MKLLATLFAATALVSSSMPGADADRVKGLGKDDEPRELQLGEMGMEGLDETLAFQPPRMGTKRNGFSKGSKGSKGGSKGGDSLLILQPQCRGRCLSVGRRGQSPPGGGRKLNGREQVPSFERCSPGLMDRWERLPLPSGLFRLHNLYTEECIRKPNYCGDTEASFVSCDSHYAAVFLDSPHQLLEATCSLLGPDVRLVTGGGMMYAREPEMGEEMGKEPEMEEEMDEENGLAKNRYGCSRMVHWEAGGAYSGGYDIWLTAMTRLEQRELGEIFHHDD